MEIVGPQQHNGLIRRCRITIPVTHKYCLLLNSRCFFLSILLGKIFLLKAWIYKVQAAIAAAVVVDLLIIIITRLCSNPQMQGMRMKKYSFLHLRQ